VSSLIAVDGGEPVEQIAARFERTSPQRTVELPADNVLGVPPQTATFVAHGWVALVRKLRAGEHTITATLTDVRERYDVHVLHQRRSGQSPRR